jgi:hypothetical protein
MISSLERRSPGREQNAEHIKCARADFDRKQSGIFIPPEQAAPVEMEPFKQKNVGRGECFHASASPAFLNLVTF